MLIFSRDYDFTVENVQNLVQPNRIGNYRLGYYDSSNGCYVKYVGRSNDLYRRLLQHIADGGRYTVFRFAYARNENEAYEQECEDYHYFSRPTGSLDNEIHPAKPANFDGVCQICRR